MNNPKYLELSAHIKSISTVRADVSIYKELTQGTIFLLESVITTSNNREVANSLKTFLEGITCETDGVRLTDNTIDTAAKLANATIAVSRPKSSTFLNFKKFFLNILLPILISLFTDLCFRTIDSNEAQVQQQIETTRYEQLYELENQQLAVAKSSNLHLAQIAKLLQENPDNLEILELFLTSLEKSQCNCQESAPASDFPQKSVADAHTLSDD